VLIAGLVFAGEKNAGIASLLAGLQGFADPFPAVPSLVIFAALALVLWLFAVRGQAGPGVTARSGGVKIEEM